MLKINYELRDKKRRIPRSLLTPIRQMGFMGTMGFM
jgi:hypothetical protein